MEAWVQPASPTVGSSPPADILGKGYDGTNEMTLRARGGFYDGVFFNNNTGSHIASGGVETTNWTYLVSTYDGTNWNLYVNGALVQASLNSIGAGNFTAPWAIGDGTTATAGGNSGDLRFFSGNITEVALYTNGLTPAQVLNHFYFGEIGASPTNSAPIIVTQPQPQTAFVGGTATFSVSAVSAFPTTNLWLKNGAPLSGKTNATLTLNNVSAGDAVNYSVVIGNGKGATNSVPAGLTLLASGNSLKWNSGGANGVWDTGTSFDWLNLTNSIQTNFTSNDQVLFDDTVGVSNLVTISGTVSPSVITVNSSTNNFTFSNSGNISGAGSLVKQGSSLLTIINPANFTGTVTIKGGTVYAGNNCFNSVSSITITNNSTWDIAGATVPGNKPVTVSGAGVNGAGALFDSFGGSSESLNITMAGDTTFGGSARWDLASGSQISGAHNLTVDWSADTGNPYGEWNSLNIGASVASITLTNKTHLGSHNNTVAFQNPGTVFTIGTNAILYVWDGWNGSLHVLGGGQLDIEYPSGVAPFNGSTITFEDNAQFLNYNFSGDEPVNSAIILNGVARLLNGDHNTFFTNLISGAGGFVCDAFNHAMVFSAANTYSGPTIIGAGPQVALTNNGSISHSSLIFFGGNDPTVVHMDVSGRPDQTLTLASGQTLSGIGTINGSLTVGAGATISPAGTNTAIGITTGTNATGTINVANVVTLNGTNIFKLNHSGESDKIQAGASITYGGTIILNNINTTPLANGDSFQIFNAPSYIGGSYTIMPNTPGPGLAWDTSQLNTFGSINVVVASQQPVVNSVHVSGGSLIFSGTGGTAGNHYAVLTTTNLTTLLTNWTSLVTNSFDGAGAFSVTNAISGGTPQRFYTIKLVP